MTVAAMEMVKCQGCQHVYVRPGEKYCTQCEEWAVQFETKRLADQRKRRAYGVGEFSPVCEASDFPAILVGVPVRERLIIAGLAICGLGVTLGVGTLLWLGAKAAVGMLLKVSATS